MCFFFSKLHRVALRNIEMWTFVFTVTHNRFTVFNKACTTASQYGRFSNYSFRRKSLCTVHLHKLSPVEMKYRVINVPERTL